MPFVNILGREVRVDFVEGRNPQVALDQNLIMGGLNQMVDLINATPWTDAQAECFRGMHGIVFFEGWIKVNGTEMDRPCCDEDDAVFYWEGNEFTFNMDPRVHAHTFFHDCFHVAQFKRDGDFARTEDVRVAREVEAIDRQLEVAQTLNCRPEDIQFLRDFQGDQGRLLARLKEGVRMHHA